MESAVPLTEWPLTGSDYYDVSACLQPRPQTVVQSLKTEPNISRKLQRRCMELQRDCPECGAPEFYRAASTEMHLGEKVKWHCTECDYGFIKIDNTVDSASA